LRQVIGVWNINVEFFWYLKNFTKCKSSL